VLAITSTAVESGAGAGGVEVFFQLFGHVLPHRIGTILGLPVFNTQHYQLIALGLMVVVFGSLRLVVDAGRPVFPLRLFRGWCLWIRDEMVYPVMGKEDGRLFLPYFLYVFFFIAFMNLIGLVPFGGTATASIFCTAGLALTSLFLIVGAGIHAQGARKFIVNLVPHGLPKWLVPLMFLVEVVGLLVKPFALMIRLFANMTGGHLVVLSLIGIIFFFAESLGGLTYGVALPAVGMSVFIMIIEGFVALLQAYIFTMLTIVFVAMYRHPDH
jgi:F-type H+-transporting ATPase subunit a